METTRAFTPSAVGFRSGNRQLNLKAGRNEDNLRRTHNLSVRNHREAIFDSCSSVRSCCAEVQAGEDQRGWVNTTLYAIFPRHRGFHWSHGRHVDMFRRYAQLATCSTGTVRPGHLREPMGRGCTAILTLFHRAAARTALRAYSTTSGRLGVCGRKTFAVQGDTVGDSGKIPNSRTP